MDHTEKEITQILVKEYNYADDQVGAVVKKILQLDSAITVEFYQWLETRQMPDRPNYEGFTPASIFDAFRLKPPACFLLMDWIKRDPKEAQTALLEDFGRELFESAKSGMANLGENDSRK